MPKYLRWLFFLGLAVSAAAQEKSALETAKSDLNALPVTKADLGQATMPALPKIDAPATLLKDKNPIPTPPAGALRRGREQDSGEGSRNWLVDAMMKDDRSTAADRSKAGSWRAKNGNEVEGLELTGAEAEKAGTASELKQGGRSGTGTTRHADNPLNPYMSDWISKRDLAILLPEKGPSAFAGGREFLPEERPAGIYSAGILNESGVSSAGAPHAITSPKVQNPYLDASAPADFTERSRSPLPNSQLAPPAGAARAPVLPEPPGRVIRQVEPMDLAKPKQDAKYYPQLKRF